MVAAGFGRRRAGGPSGLYSCDSLFPPLSETCGKIERFRLGLEGRGSRYRSYGDDTADRPQAGEQAGTSSRSATHERTNHDPASRLRVLGSERRITHSPSRPCLHIPVPRRRRPLVVPQGHAERRPADRSAHPRALRAAGRQGEGAGRPPGNGPRHPLRGP